MTTDTLLYRQVMSQLLLVNPATTHYNNVIPVAYMLHNLPPNFLPQNMPHVWGSGTTFNLWFSVST